jgi:hypothetical protein
MSTVLAALTAASALPAPAAIRESLALLLHRLLGLSVCLLLDNHLLPTGLALLALQADLLAGLPLLGSRLRLLRAQSLLTPHLFLTLRILTLRLLALRPLGVLNIGLMALLARRLALAGNLVSALRLRLGLTLDTRAPRRSGLAARNLLAPFAARTCRPKIVLPLHSATALQARFIQSAARTGRRLAHGRHQAARQRAGPVGTALRLYTLLLGHAAHVLPARFHRSLS